LDSRAIKSTGYSPVVVEERLPLDRAIRKQVKATDLRTAAAVTAEVMRRRLVLAVVEAALIRKDKARQLQPRRLR
jgi:hypothetical protein